MRATEYYTFNVYLGHSESPCPLFCSASFSRVQRLNLTLSRRVSLVWSRYAMLCSSSLPITQNSMTANNALALKPIVRTVSMKIGKRQSTEFHLKTMNDERRLTVDFSILSKRGSLPQKAQIVNFFNQDKPAKKMIALQHPNSRSNRRGRDGICRSLGFRRRC